MWWRERGRKNGESKRVIGYMKADLLGNKSLDFQDEMTYLYCFPILLRISLFYGFTVLSFHGFMFNGFGVRYPNFDRFKLMREHCLLHDQRQFLFRRLSLALRWCGDGDSH